MSRLSAESSLADSPVVGLDKLCSFFNGALVAGAPSLLRYGSMTFLRLLIDGLGCAVWILRLLLTNGSGGGCMVSVFDFFRRRKNEEDFLFSAIGGCAVTALSLGSCGLGSLFGCNDALLTPVCGLGRAIVTSA